MTDENKSEEKELVQGHTRDESSVQPAEAEVGNAEFMQSRFIVNGQEMSYEEMKAHRADEKQGQSDYDAMLQSEAAERAAKAAQNGVQWPQRENEMTGETPDQDEKYESPKFAGSSQERRDAIEIAETSGYMITPAGGGKPLTLTELGALRRAEAASYAEAQADDAQALIDDEAARLAKSAERAAEAAAQNEVSPAGEK